MLALFLFGMYVLPGLHLAFHRFPHVHLGDAILQPEKLSEILQRNAASAGVGLREHELRHIHGIAHGEPDEGNHSSPSGSEQQNDPSMPGHGAGSSSHFTALIADQIATTPPLFAAVEQVRALTVRAVVLSSIQDAFDIEIWRGPPSSGSRIS